MKPIDRSSELSIEDLEKARGFITHTRARDTTRSRNETASHRAVLKHAHAHLRTRSRPIFPYPRRSAYPYRVHAKSTHHGPRMVNIRPWCTIFAWTCARSRDRRCIKWASTRKSRQLQQAGAFEFHHEIPCEWVRGSTLGNFESDRVDRSKSSIARFD
jgi:hypothetical protein